MRILLTLAMLSSVAFGVSNAVSKVPTANTEFLLNKQMGAVGLKTHLGTVIRQAHNTAVGEWDFTKQGGGPGAISIGVTLPNNAIIRNVIADVIIAPTSAGATELNLTAQSAADLMARVPKGSLSIGKYQGLPDFATIGDQIKLTGQAVVSVHLTGEVATAGKIKYFIDYVVSE